MQHQHVLKGILMRISSGIDDIHRLGIAAEHTSALTWVFTP